MVKKDKDYIPLNESEYTDVEINEFSSCDGFTNSIPFDDDNVITVFSFSDNDNRKIDNTQSLVKSFEFVQNTKLNSKNDSLNIKNGHNSQNNKTDPLVSSYQSKSQVQKVRGLTPAINGETFDIKRCYQFRTSTLKKLNKIKGESDNINIYLNEIIDAAICFYYDSVFNHK